MTGQSDFTEQEWEQVLEGPTAAGMMVITASKGGTFRETFAMAKAYAEARQEHGQSQLLDAIVSHKPEIDHHHAHSVDEIKTRSLQHLRDAIAVLEQKATPDEVDQYRQFVLTLADKVASAHEEHGMAVSGLEQSAIDEIKSALGAT
jgi:hypothetical protein